MKIFYFTIEKGNLDKHIFFDLFEDKRVEKVFVYRPKTVFFGLSMFLYCQNDEWFSPFFSSMRKKAIKEFSIIDKVSKEEKNIIIIYQYVLDSLRTRQIEKLKSLENVKVYLFLIDSVFWIDKKKHGWLKKMKVIGEENIYTTDIGDTEKYNFKEYKTYYSSLNIKAEKPVLGVSFYGNLKGRGDMLRRIYKKLNANDIECSFNVPGRKVGKGINKLGKGLPYEEMLEKSLKYSTILELCQEGQKGCTLRYFESVCYNRKLLTNNSYIKNMPFYNERYMKIIKSEEDIDIEWLNDTDMPEYNYNGEFSPKFLLESIIKANI